MINSQHKRSGSDKEVFASKTGETTPKRRKYFLNEKEILTNIISSFLRGLLERTFTLAVPENDVKSVFGFENIAGIKKKNNV